MVLHKRALTLGLILSLMASNFLFPTTVHAAMVCYVAVQASGGANTGLSWADAYTDLQSALAESSPCTEIWVAAGTYKPTDGADRGVSFVLKNGVALYGGFAGLPAETQRDQRDPSVNETILSGDIGAADVITDNSYHVVLAGGVDGTAVLDGFTITKGNADGVAPWDSGAGLLITSGSPTLTRLKFENNKASNLGGAIYAENNLDVNDSAFSYNQARLGGAVALAENAAGNIAGSEFSHNSAVASGEGGALWMNTGALDVASSVFTGNTADNIGGAIRSRGSLSVEGSVFVDNTAGSGAGLYSDGGVMDVRSASFSSNIASAYGGAVFVSAENSSIEGSFFSENVAYYGGGIYKEDHSLSVSNSTLYLNSATELVGGILNYAGVISLVNNTISGNIDGGVYNNTGAVLNYKNNIVANSTGFDCWNDGTISGNLNNLVEDNNCSPYRSGDPNVEAPADNGGNTYTMALLSGSLAVNAGDETTCNFAPVNGKDQRGVDRPQGGACDIGAYEAVPLSVVTNNGDSGPGSLRYVLSRAFPGTVITFDPALSGSTITLLHTLTLSQNITIDASSLPEKITISGDWSGDGGGDVQVFRVVSGVTALFESLNITKGRGANGGGGGIWNAGALTIRNTSVTDCIASENISSGHAGGGGIWNSGTMGIENSLISNNYVRMYGMGQGGGGGVFNSGRLGMSGTTVSNNTAHTDSTSMLRGNGGGIYNSGILDLNTSVISGNAAYAYSGRGGRGGGIFTETSPTIVDTQFLDNHADLWGGGLFSQSSTTLQLDRDTFIGNSANSGGGAVSASQGPSHEIFISNSTFAENTTSGTGGGVFVSAARVTRSTFSGNSAASGGGIYSSYGNAEIKNSTFYGNSAGAFGGAIYANALVATHTTISGNSAGNAGAGVYTNFSVVLYNSIVANSVSGSECAYGPNNGAYVSYSIIEDGSCSAAWTGDPKLAPLANNGGMTKTMALYPGSPAIDSGDAARCIPFFDTHFDQRGVSRPIGTQCDIGAVEAPVYTQRLKNGSFGSYVGASKIPSSWKALNFGILDGKDKKQKKDATPSVKMTGLAGKTKTLTQTMMMAGSAGDPFTFSYWTKAGSMPAQGMCQAQVLFYNGTALKGTKTLKCPAGSTYNWKKVASSFIAPSAYTKVIITFTYSKSKGAVWFDLVSLMK